MHNGVPFDDSVRICIGVCTRRRPQLLTQCLVSLNMLEEPLGCAVEVIVVDNNDAPDEQELVETYEVRPDGLPFHYVHEPRLGIAHARNAVLDKALELRADWIGMVDDDQILPWNWLCEMWAAVHEYPADVVKSAVRFVYPTPLPLWACPKTRKHKWRLDANMATTNGVLFRSWLAREDGLALRFNDEFNLSSGEDRDFFKRAYLAGAKIVHTPDAVAEEFMPETKLSFSAQVAREYWQEVTNTRQDRRFDGFLAALCFKTSNFLNHMLFGFFYAVTSPVSAVVSRRRARRQLLKGAKKIAKAAGIAVGLLGVARPEPYRTIHGS